MVADDAIVEQRQQAGCAVAAAHAENAVDAAVPEHLHQVVCAVPIRSGQVAVAAADVGREFDLEAELFENPNRAINGPRIGRRAGGGDEAERGAGRKMLGPDKHAPKVISSERQPRTSKRKLAGTPPRHGSNLRVDQDGLLVAEEEQLDFGLGEGDLQFLDVSSRRWHRPKDTEILEALSQEYIRERQPRLRDMLLSAWAWKASCFGFSMD